MSDEPDYKAALLAIINGEGGYAEVWPDGELLIDGVFSAEPVKSAVEALVAEGLIERPLSTPIDRWTIPADATFSYKRPDTLTP